MEGSGNRIVDAVGHISITGNVIPQVWYKTITHASGKPYLIAIVILADIVYWYRPAEVRDERSGQVVAYRKRFKADLLQRSYADLSEQFGITKREATNAIVALEKLGVVKRHLRTIEVQGQKLPNVLFLELIPEALSRITFPKASSIANDDLPHLGKGQVSHQEGIGVPFESDTSHFEKGHVSHQEGTPLTVKRETNTETTTETTTETSTVLCGSDDANVADEFEERRTTHPTRAEVRQFCRDNRLRIDADRFFDLNEQREWLTKDGRPVVDWKRYALTWDRHERDSVATPVKTTVRQAKPSIEQVMKDYHVSREKAEGMIRECLA